MYSIKKWLSKLFDGMGYAFMHPIKDSLPPNIGTHAYRDKPYKSRKRLWNT